jgi:hypothetical protein
MVAKNKQCFVMTKEKGLIESEHPLILYQLTGIHDLILLAAIDRNS